MLLSQGHSPRLISSPTPSETLHPDSSFDSQSEIRKGSNRSTILDEDAYVSAIEKIVERDFFPDIPKLRDRLDWVEAIRSGDPVQIRDVQLKIMERRAGRESRSRIEGDRSRTPFCSVSRAPSNSEDFKTPEVQMRKTNICDTSAEDPVDVSALSLDQFFRRYTSEDNASFLKVLEKTNKKRKERFSHLLEGEKVELKIDDGGKRNVVMTDGYGTSDRPLSTLDGWKYVAKNLLMYHPCDRGEVSLTEEEVSVRVKGLTKEISLENTRYCGREGESMKEVHTVSGEDGEKRMRVVSHGLYKESEGGYRFVRTPSPSPDGSPIVTWGEIDGTPLRLDASAGSDVDGPHYDIPRPPARDVMGHSLSREASRNLKERLKLFRKPLPPIRGRSSSPLSPAAQRFMRNAMSKSSSNVDESLRATYRGNTPTPKSARSLSRFGRPPGSSSP